ncbi:predicted protein [Methanosarcina acetivorans C2A]|uniref:Uncharacterized protein n=2 Tax=Methanosarcina acetivorans TaxID=2214 RepID=Q8TTC3_METAC|nr:predicted protein [Methanosarcina acetivorans C2A]
MYISVPKIFCKTANHKKLQGRKFHIGRTKLHTVHKKLTWNLQQIRDTAFCNLSTSKKELYSGEEKLQVKYMKKDETYFRLFDSVIGYDGAVIRGGNSIEVRIMRGLGSLGYLLYMILVLLPIAYLLIILFSMIFEKIM